jgi:hypothetical protein
MSLSAIRSGVDQALSSLTDSALSYRTGGAGAWLSFSGGVLNTDTPVSVGFDEDEGGEVQFHTGMLVARLSSVVLSVGDQVRDHLLQAWAVVGVDRSVSAAIYRLRREPLSDAAYSGARGGKE